MRTLLVLATATVAGVVLWRFGAPPLWAVTLAVPPAALVLLASYLPSATDVVWQSPPEPPNAIASVQASALATRLQQAAEEKHRYEERIRPRLKKLGIDTPELPPPDQLTEMLRRVE